PASGSSTGLNALVASTRALLYGTVEARVKQGPIGGVITAFTLMNYSTLDEVDLEWVGSDRTSVWTNFFLTRSLGDNQYRGRRERDATTTFEIWASNPSVSNDTYQNYHDYRVDWTPYALTYYVDGQVVHQQNRSGTWETANTGDMMPYDHYHYPDTPLLVTMGIWNDNDVAWSNGPVDWTSADAANGYTAEFASLKVTCYTGPYPSNMSAPPTDPSSSDTLGTGPGESSPVSITGGVVSVYSSTTVLENSGSTVASTTVTSSASNSKASSATLPTGAAGAGPLRRGASVGEGVAALVAQAAVAAAGMAALLLV
ncbi:hypothetical protein HK405_001033, partial [Cladochytrium tenue]